MVFTVLNEKNKFKNARAIAKICVNGRNYLLYFVNDYDDNDYNIMISLLANNGQFDYLKHFDIEKDIFLIKKKLEIIIEGVRNE